MRIMTNITWILEGKKVGKVEKVKKVRKVRKVEKVGKIRKVDINITFMVAYFKNLFYLEKGSLSIFHYYIT